MALSEDVPSNAEVGHFNRTIQNAKRLAADARLLIENGRGPSAVTLMILAIEELGKALINIWGVRNTHNKREFASHIEKQSAVFALLAGIETTKMSKARLRRRFAQGFNFHTFGPMHSQFAYARSGFFENVRMTLTYADEKPIYDLSGFDEAELPALAKELLAWFEEAGSAFTNTPAMELAATFYENDLGRA